MEGLNNDNQQAKTAEELSKQPAASRDLDSIMRQYTDERLPAADETGATRPASVLPPEIENSADFKALPPEEQARLRAGGSFNPMGAELDAVGSQQAMFDMINAARLRDGKEMLEPEVVKEGGITKELLTEGLAERDDQAEEADRDLQELIGAVTNDPTAGRDQDPEAEMERTLREFERHLEVGTPVYFNEDDKPTNPKSAAYPVVVRRNEEYIDTLKDALDANGIQFKTKKNNGARKALLKGFTQRKTHVSVPLVNSGIYVTLAGANIPELIQMQSLVESGGETVTATEIRKLGFVVKHLVDSSVGSHLSVSQLTKLVYFKDQDTLYFDMVAATFPGENDFPMTCENEKCKDSLILKVSINDMILNAHEFQEEANFILYENQSADDIIKKSAVSREKRIVLPNGLILGVKNPTIYDVLHLNTLMVKLHEGGTKLDQYTNILGYLQFVNYIAIKAEDGPHYEKFTATADTADVADLLAACDTADLAALDEEIEEFTPTKGSVRYGFKEYTCPKCGHVHKERAWSMSDMLFTLASMEAAKENIARLNKKKLKDATTK